jgi:hypothetical protein
MAALNGPFAETRELEAGYAVWDVKDKDKGEALAWAKRWPPPRASGGVGTSFVPVAWRCCSAGRSVLAAVWCWWA